MWILTITRSTRQVKHGLSGKITISSNDFYVVLIETKGEDCHACGAKLSAAVYYHPRWTWELYHKQLNFVELGSWGETPTQDRKDISYVPLTRPNYGAIIFVDDGFYDQGEGNDGVDLLYFDEGKSWKFLGFIETGGSDLGNCAKGSEKVAFNACYSWTGKIEPEVGKDGSWPSLIVKESGTKFDENGFLIPAFDLRYEFNGAKYVKVSTKRSGVTTNGSDSRR
jgi:hypothetical protein